MLPTTRKQIRVIMQRFWANYFNTEKGIYEQSSVQIPRIPKYKGTVKELAEKYWV